MSQLPDSEDQDQGGLEGEEEVDYDSRPTKKIKQNARTAAMMSGGKPRLSFCQHTPLIVSY